MNLSLLLNGTCVIGVLFGFQRSASTELGSGQLLLLLLLLCPGFNRNGKLIARGWGVGCHLDNFAKTSESFEAEKMQVGQ